MRKFWFSTSTKFYFNTESLLVLSGWTFPDGWSRFGDSPSRFKYMAMIKSNDFHFTKKIVNFLFIHMILFDILYLIDFYFTRWYCIPREENTYRLSGSLSRFPVSSRSFEIVLVRFHPYFKHTNSMKFKP